MNLRHGLVLLFPDAFVQKIISGKGAHLREGLREVLISPGGEGGGGISAESFRWL